MGDDTPQTPARARPHTHSANRQPRTIRSPGTGRARRRTTEVMADLPQGTMQAESSSRPRPRRVAPSDAGQRATDA